MHTLRLIINRLLNLVGDQMSPEDWLDLVPTQSAAMLFSDLLDFLR